MSNCTAGCKCESMAVVKYDLKKPTYSNSAVFVGLNVIVILPHVPALYL